MTIIDWSCECGVRAENVPVSPGVGVCHAAVSHHAVHYPCEIILNREHCVRAVRRMGVWIVTISKPQPSIPNPKRRKTA
jgi:hypothetical protein